MISGHLRVLPLREAGESSGAVNNTWVVYSLLKSSGSTASNLRMVTGGQGSLSVCQGEESQTGFRYQLCRLPALRPTWASSSSVLCLRFFP